MFGGLSGIGSSLRPAIAGAVGGFAYGFGRGIHPQFGGPAALAGVGMFMKNDTLLTLAGIEIAQSFGQNVGPSGAWL